MAHSARDNIYDEEIAEILAPYLQSEAVQSMSGYCQHGDVSTLEHCLSVTRKALQFDALLPGSSDKEVLVVAGLLHDFYLYDWHGSGWKHSYQHPLKAAENAREYFNVDPRVAEAIESHMWPIGISHPPKSREALLICLADKWCALTETLFHRKRAK